MTTLIQQRSNSDCVVFCLAMATGRSYDAVLESISDIYDPKQGVARESEALRRLGLSDKFESGEPAGDFVCIHRGYYISTEYFRSQAWRRRALMSVPSLNYEGGWHMVYWCGRFVWDPSPGKIYRLWSELHPDYITLFDETKAQHMA